MKDKPLLHSRQFYNLVLKYFFRNRHCSFPNRNPHMNRLTHMMISVRNSTMTQPFKALIFRDDALHAKKEHVNLDA
jgi:hypothetical protein